MRVSTVAGQRVGISISLSKPLPLKRRRADQSGAMVSRSIGKQEGAVMPREPRIYLSFDSWPIEDQARWQAAFKEGDRFEGSGPGSHLAEATRRNLWISYARFLAFLSANRHDLLHLRPEARVDRRIVADYVAWRRRSCGDGMVAVDLDCLRGALRLICPGVDGSWLLTLASASRPRPRANLRNITWSLAIVCTHSELSSWIALLPRWRVPSA